jgi:hypothetical protein
MFTDGADVDRELRYINFFEGSRGLLVKRKQHACELDLLEIM